MDPLDPYFWKTNKMKLIDLENILLFIFLMFRLSFTYF